MVDRRPPGVDPDGLQRKEEVISVQIPAGVVEGMQLSVSGKGNAGRNGGQPGDLIVLVEEEAHPLLVAILIQMINAIGVE
jgi:molecular chaperone DnaJ